MMITPTKKSGETMGNFVSRVKATYSLSKLAYTARLDPMAKGVVPFLIGSQCLKISQSLNSNKTYQVKIIIGIQTDTDDPLGIISSIKEYDLALEELIKQSICNYLDLLDSTTFKQKYHHYSTKMMNHRRRGVIVDDSTHLVSVLGHKIIKESKYSFDDFKSKVIKKINLIDKSNNFRQDVIVDQWEKMHLETLSYIKLEISVSSGFFIRQLIRDMSESIGFPLMCYNINRVSID
jgi:tRNA pseudouridine(55) synthase